MAQTFFGTPEQQSVTRTAAKLWQILKDDPRFGTHGRAIGLNGMVDDDLETQLALAGIQGVAPLDAVADDVADAREAELKRLGYATDRYGLWIAGPEALEIAARTVECFRPPEDLELEWVDADTPLSRLQDLSGLLALCEMMLPMENVVRGIQCPSVYAMLRDRSGCPVAHASSTAAYHPEAPNGGEAHWGMLATLPERRGQGLAAWLGALAMIEMNRRHGFEAFGTGIRKGNTPSEALCSRLGMAPSGRSVLLAIDTHMLSGEKLTK